MNSSSTAKARVHRVSRAILAVGFVAAAVIYFVNGAAPDTSAFELEESKKYLREMEVFGGKANLLASQLRHWFDGLWHGRTLAFTVAVISVLLALAYEFLGTPLPPGEGSSPREEK